MDEAEELVAVDVEESVLMARCLSLEWLELASLKQRIGSCKFATYSWLRWIKVHCHFALPALRWNLSGLVWR